jgi:hypothetical protein
VPICIYKSAEDTLIATVVGKHAFYVFNTSKLNLVFMSRFIAEEITYLQASPTGLIYTSLKETNQIIAWNKMHRHATYSPQTQNAILQFIVTQTFLFVLAEQNEFIMFDVKSTEVVKKINIPGTIRFERMMHPVTYVNKLLFYGGKTMQLWNVIQGEKIYDFTMQSEIESVD